MHGDTDLSDSASGGTVTSAKELWTPGGSDGTGAFDFSGGNILPADSSTDNAIYTTQSFAPSNFPLTFSYVYGDEAIDAGWNSGLFDAAEVGAFTAGSNNGNARYGMTKSWGLEHDAGTLWYGNNYEQHGTGSASRWAEPRL